MSGPDKTPYLDDGDFQSYNGEALDVLKTLPSGSVHCVVTSPPYWGLRDYGVEDAIGLEATPEQYVARMVEVFREVRRVLRSDGVCWVNLGDTYNAYNGGAGPSSNLSQTQSEQRPRLETGFGLQCKSLKPKDLVGIPWRVAMALQQPYYTGRISNVNDRFWLAAMVDTEGCIHIHKRSAGAKSHTHTLVDGSTVDYERKTDTYGVMVSIDNTSEALIDRIEALVGQGSRYTHEKGVGKSNRKRTLYRITLTGQQSRELLRELYPYLVAKQHEARIAYHAPSSGAGAEAAWQAIKALHNGLETTVDYPAPPTLFEPGWYLRSDVIWGKPNPMPESVTDRPTKAHEYVFLLTKSPRYFFDQEAVREPLDRADLLGAKRLKGVEGLNGQRGDVGRYSHYANPAGRNVRSVWEIATQPYPEAHFATYPEELVRRCILAGSSERGCCPECGAPWTREVETTYEPSKDGGKRGRVSDGHERRGHHNEGVGDRARRIDTTLGWRPSCGCVDETLSREWMARHHQPVPCTVLDPFGGSGTTALVARKHGRRSILVELSAEYCELAAKRLSQLSLLSGVAGG